MVVGFQGQVDLKPSWKFEQQTTQDSRVVITTNGIILPHNTEPHLSGL